MKFEIFHPNRLVFEMSEVQKGPIEVAEKETAPEFEENSVSDRNDQSASDARQLQFEQVETKMDDVNPVVAFNVGNGGKIDATGADFHDLLETKYGTATAEYINIRNQNSGEEDVGLDAKWNGREYVYTDGAQKGQKLFLKNGGKYLLMASIDQKDANEYLRDIGGVTEKDVGDMLKGINTNFFGGKLNIVNVGGYYEVSINGMGGRLPPKLKVYPGKTCTIDTWVPREERFTSAQYTREEANAYIRDHFAPVNKPE